MLFLRKCVAIRFHFFFKNIVYAFFAEMRRYKVSLLLKNSCVLFLGKRVTIRGHSGSPVSVGPQMRASQQILSLHVKCAGPQFRRPPKKLRLPRIFLFFNITRGAQWLPSERFHLLSLHKTRSESPFFKT